MNTYPAALSADGVRRHAGRGRRRTPCAQPVVTLRCSSSMPADQTSGTSVLPRT